MAGKRKGWHIVHGAGIWHIEDASRNIVCEAMDHDEVSLLLAAPDLLAACKAAFAFLAERGNPFAGQDWELGHRLSAAINKAESAPEEDDWPMMDYIRRYYGVPAKRGGRVNFDGRPGTITGAKGQYLRVRLDGSPTVILLHPTWHVEYLGKTPG